MRGPAAGRRCRHYAAGRDGHRARQCACCERAYDSLPGVTYLKAVGELRAAWGDTTLSKKSKMSNVNRMYETVRICLFCTQYFEETAENQ